MNENAPQDEDSADSPLAAIEFQSPGRFPVHNPGTSTAEPAPRQAAAFTLGLAAPLQRFSQAQQACAHALALMQQARRSLCIYSNDLEPWLYHHADVQQACTRLLLAHPRNRLRILVGDLTRSIKDGHRLLNLARRLPSNCQIRKLNPDYPNEALAFLLADDQGLLLRPKLEQYAGYALYADAAKVRLRQSQFDQAWERSLADPDLRSFLL